jgi:lysophospholipase L1-like esterase
MTAKGIHRQGRQALGGVAVVLIAVGLFFAALEGVVRIAFSESMQFDVEMWKYARIMKRVARNPEMGHEHVPGTRARLMGVDVAINDRGLRDRGYDHEKPEGVRRILMLGDSVTFGWGVAVEHTASKRLEQHLNAAAPGRFEVINTGVGNYNTAMEVTWFLNEGLRYDPDLVVLNYFINDAEQRPVRSTNPLAAWSMAYAFLAGRVDALTRIVARREDWAAYYQGLYADDQAGWRNARESIGALAAACAARDIPLLLVNHPELRELGEYRFEDVDAKLRRVAADNRLPLLELRDALRGHDEASLWVTPPDPHPNARAHALAADAIFEKLKTDFRLP